MSEEKKEIYLVKDSKVKEFAKAGGLRVASDFYAGLNVAVGRLIIQACMHARGEDRGTIRPSDIPEVRVP